MNFISKTILSLGLAFVMSACGKMSVDSKVTLISGQAANTSTFDAKTAYLNMPAPDYNVNFGYFGGKTTQRETATQFCRKSGAVVPNPVYSYQCWKHVSSGTAAQSNFNTIAAYIHHSVTIEYYSGAPAIDEATTADESMICQKTGLTVPGSTQFYDCFQKL